MTGLDWWIRGGWSGSGRDGTSSDLSTGTSLNARIAQYGGLFIDHGLDTSLACGNLRLLFEPPGLVRQDLIVSSTWKEQWY